MRVSCEVKDIAMIIVFAFADFDDVVVSVFVREIKVDVVLSSGHIDN
jgi:hypothetical protein